MKIDGNTKLIINGLEIPVENFEDSSINLSCGELKKHRMYSADIVVEIGSEADVKLRELCD